LKQITPVRHERDISHPELIELLKQDLMRKYQDCVARIQVLKAAEPLSSPGTLEELSVRELNHATIIARQIDRLSSIRLVRPKTDQRSTDLIKILPFPLASDSEIVQSYRDRIRQCRSLGEFEVGEQIRAIMLDEQKHSMAQKIGRERPAPTSVPGFIES
jgi:bacterioferritin